jgi:hypothetical protein
MDLEGIFSLILFVLHWRVALCLVASSALAIVLVNVFPWLTGLQGIVIAALGLVPGAVWEAQTTLPKLAPGTSPLETTASVAGASAIIAGATWGALSSTSMHSFVAGAAIFLLAAKAWSWCIGEFKYSVTKERMYFCIALAGFTYPIAAVLAHNAL